jgi:hypothetical protein
VDGPGPDGRLASFKKFSPANELSQAIFAGAARRGSGGLQGPGQAVSFTHVSWVATCNLSLQVAVETASAGGG